MTDGSVHCSPASLPCLPLVSGRQPTLPCLPLPSSRPLCAAQGGGAADRHQRPVKAGTQRSRHSTYRSAAPQSGAHSRHQASCILSLKPGPAWRELKQARVSKQVMGRLHTPAPPSCTCSCVRPCRLHVHQPDVAVRRNLQIVNHGWPDAPPTHCRIEEAVGLLQERLPRSQIVLLGLLPAGVWGLPGQANYSWPSKYSRALPVVNTRLRLVCIVLCLAVEPRAFTSAAAILLSSLTGRCSAATRHLQGVCGRPAQGAIPGLRCSLPRAKRHRHRSGADAGCVAPQCGGHGAGDCTVYQAAGRPADANCNIAAVYL